MKLVQDDPLDILRYELAELRVLRIGFVGVQDIPDERKVVLDDHIYVAQLDGRDQ